MEVVIKNNKRVIITKPKALYFHLPVNVEDNLKHQID